MTEKKCDKYHPYVCLPELAMPDCQLALKETPSDDDCFKLWQKYEMRPNIQEHSLQVAKVAECLALRAEEKGWHISVRLCRAAALLHDIAKTYCLEYGGSHAALGAAWALRETGNYKIAQSVLLHVNWPWPLPNVSAVCCEPVLVLYADKRVRHNEFVSLQQRYEDILIRYGKNSESRKNIMEFWNNSIKIEQLLSIALDWNLNEYSFNCGRMVK